MTLTREQHNALLTARRAMLRAIKDAGMHGPKTAAIVQFLDDLKDRLSANVPPTIAQQSDI